MLQFCTTSIFYIRLSHALDLTQLPCRMDRSARITVRQLLHSNSLVPDPGAAGDARAAGYLGLRRAEREALNAGGSTICIDVSRVLGVSPPVVGLPRYQIRELIDIDRHLRVVDARRAGVGREGAGDI